MEKFGRWMSDMAAQGAVIASHGLAHTGRVLRGSRGAMITDGPYAEAREVVGGYVLIAADDIEQATEFARGCPGLDYPMAVEIRPVIH
jgi:hypothetical protein